MLLLALLAGSVAGRVSYQGQRVLSCALDTAAKRELVATLDLDVWAQMPGGRTHLRVTGEDESMLADGGVACEVYIESVQALLDREMEQREQAGPAQSWHEEYHSPDEIIDFLRGTCAAAGPLCEFTESVGVSVEGRAIPELRLRGAANNGTRRWFWLSGVHSREFISPALVQWYVEDFLAGYGRDAEITKLLDTFEIVIVPMVNPDGVLWAYTEDRLWRKNRSENPGSLCMGTDLNRNAGTPDTWGGAGSSPVACSDTYHGTAYLSEPETQAWVSVWEKIKDTVEYGVDFHSYGQLILRPPGVRAAGPHPNEEEMRRIGDIMVDAILAVDGELYESMPAYDLYPTVGSTDDLFSMKDDIVSHCIEARDRGRQGFLLSPEFIIPNALELRAGMLAVAENLY